MKKIKILVYTLWIVLISNIAEAQNTDNHPYKSCEIMHDNGMFREALECYQEFGTKEETLYQSAIIAKELEDEKLYKNISNKLVKGKHVTPKSIVYYSRLMTDGSSKQLKVIKKGLRKFPADTFLLETKMRYFVKLEDYEYAGKVADQLIEHKKGEHETIYFAKGVIYGLSNNNEKALEAYHKAVEINPSYLDPYYNIAIAYFNVGVDFYEESYDSYQMYVKAEKTDANTSEYASEYEKKKEQGDDEFKKAIPYLKKAQAIQPNSLAVLEALKTIYETLDMRPEQAEINRQIEKMSL